MSNFGKRPSELGSIGIESEHLNICKIRASLREKELLQGDQAEFKSTSELEDQTILCVELLSTKLGLCVLDLPEQTLKVLNEDIEFTYSGNNTAAPGMDSSNFSPIDYEYELNSLLESLIREHNPSLVFVSSKIEVFAYDMLKDLAAELEFRLQMRAQEYFRKEVFTSSWNLFQDEAPLIFIEGFTLLDELPTQRLSLATLMALSCVVKSIESNIVTENESFSPTRFFDQISKVEQIVMKDRLFIDEDALSALQIFDSPELSGHDRLIKNGCFSIYQLLSLNSSDASKKLLVSWLRAPLTNRDKILQRYGVINILLLEGHAILFDELIRSLKGLPHITKIVTDIGRGKNTLTIWRNCVKFLEKTLDILSVVCSLNDDTKNLILLSNIENINQHPIKQILEKITFVIDLEASASLGTVVIRDGVSDVLDQKREKYYELDQILNVVAVEAKERLLPKINLAPKRHPKSDVPSGSLVNALYVPQLGYLISADLQLERYISSANLDWEELFRTETTIYLKNDDTRAMDEHYGDLYGAITDIEVEVLHGLQSELMNCKNLLLTCGRLFSELEVLTAFARVSQIYNYTEPEIVDDECQLSIEKGRHPLYESLVETYIPNDIDLRGGKINNADWAAENQRIAIITGANASGKSVFLSQNGLIVFLSHVGCFVPAEKARIGLVDKILTRIRTRETILKTQSTFQLDSHQMSKCLSLGSEKSLLLIDEFGKGTDVVDGPALFGAVMVEMSKKSNCPRILACTHYRELFTPSVLSPSIEGVAFYKTEIIFEGSTLEHVRDMSKSTISFLYKITEGIAESSLGIFCAQQCGIRKEILERGQKIAEIMSNGKDIVEKSTDILPEDLLKLARDQEIVKSFVCWDLTLEENALYPTDELSQKLQQILYPV